MCGIAIGMRGGAVERGAVMKHSKSKAAVTGSKVP
jgi:hypothetical protein